jgi:hypothetical protein
MGHVENVTNKMILIVLIFLNAVSVFAGELQKIEDTIHVQYGFTLRNTRHFLLENAELWTYAPRQFGLNYECEQLHATLSYQLINDSDNNRILYFKIPTIAPLGSKILTIKAALKKNTRQHQKSDDSTSFTKSEKYIESDHPDIIDQAKKLKKTTPEQTSLNIFKWVSKNMTYSGYIKNDRGALWALNHHKGDCTEYMYLFIALCRALHIPARGIGGYVINKKNQILLPGNYHNWAEIYIHQQWQIVDPQKKVFFKSEKIYLPMRLIGEKKNSPMKYYHRYHFSGNGLTVKMRY